LSEETEIVARKAWDAQDYEAVTAAVLEAYGPELYSFLLARFGLWTSHAEDVFSDFTEDLWRSLPTFQWRCSIRAWCYKLARSAAARFRRSPHNRAQRCIPLSAAHSVEELMVRLRTSTRPHLRTDVKDQIQKLREKLTTEERDLLIMRIDRKLSWREVAFAMLGPDDETDDENLRKMEVRLRQRFAEVKKRLKQLAIEAGLV
jgi:RNA polymerase sigma-70 factor (ECF subfamily)